MKKEAIIGLIFSVLIPLIFFYQIILGKVPFPGDLLVGNYEPYRSLSYKGYAPGAVPNKAQGPDVIKELMPWKKFTVESFKRLQIPLWNPYNFSGNPHLANFQSGVFYPLNLIFLIFDFPSAWTIYILFAPTLSVYFTFLFLRRLKLAVSSSLFGGTVFAFSLYMSVWMEYGNIGHTFIWLPLGLYFADKLLEKIDRTTLLGLAISLFFASIAGYIQGLFYIFTFIFLYFFFKGRFERRLSFKKIALFITALVFPILFSMFQILPTLELFSASTRGNYSLDQISKILNPVWYLVTVIVPDFFGNPAARNFWFNGTYIERVSYFGVVPAAFCIYSICTLMKKTEVKIFTVIFLTTLFLTTDFYITRFLYLIPIPVISTTIPTRMLSLFAFSGAFLSAFGFDAFITSKNSKLILIIVLTMLVLLGILYFFSLIYPTIGNQVTSSELSVSKRNILIPAFCLGVFILFSLLKNKIKSSKNIIVFGVFLITIFELAYYFLKITPFSPRDYLYPQTPVVSFLKINAGIDRFWGYGSGYIESNFQTFDATFGVDGNDPLHIREYTQLLSASKNGRIPDVLPRPDANVAGGFGSQDLANNPYRQKVLNIVGVKYILNRNEALRGSFEPDETTFPRDRFKLVWQKDFWQVYENLRVTPRYFLTNKYQVVSSRSQALHTLFKPEFSEINTLILYEDPKISTKEFKGKVKLDLYTPNKVIITADSTSEALLYLSDNYYPGWNAYVDGRESKIFIADYSFRAVKVPRGIHKVVFEFTPKSFYYGLYISFASFLIFILFLSLMKMNRNSLG